MPLSLRLIDAAARLVPPSARGEWAREWKAEVLHRRALLARRGALDPGARLALALRALGALPDALAMRRIAEERAGVERVDFFAASPARAMAAVGVLALAAYTETVLFATASAVWKHFPLGVGIASALVGAAVLRAATTTAAAVLVEHAPASVRRIRQDPPLPRRARIGRGAGVLALLGGAEGLALVLATLHFAPTEGAARVLSGALGWGALAFHAGVSAALGALLTYRLRHEPLR